MRARVFFFSAYFSLLRRRYLGRHATLLSGGEALRDDPNNGCEGDYAYLVNKRFGGL